MNLAREHLRNQEAPKDIGKIPQAAATQERRRAHSTRAEGTRIQATRKQASTRSAVSELFRPREMDLRSLPVIVSMITLLWVTQMGRQMPHALETTNVDQVPIPLLHVKHNHPSHLPKRESQSSHNTLRRKRRTNTWSSWKISRRGWVGRIDIMHPQVRVDPLHPYRRVLNRIRCQLNIRKSQREPGRERSMPEHLHLISVITLHKVIWWRRILYPNREQPRWQESQCWLTIRKSVYRIIYRK